MEVVVVLEISEYVCCAHCTHAPWQTSSGRGYKSGPWQKVVEKKGCREDEFAIVECRPKGRLGLGEFWPRPQNGQQFSAHLYLHDYPHQTKESVQKHP